MSSGNLEYKNGLEMLGKLCYNGTNMKSRKANALYEQGAFAAYQAQRCACALLGIAQKRMRKK